MLLADAPPRPAIVQSPIVFDARRVAQTRAYARRHYGRNRARLIDPKVIVIHLTGSTTYASAFNTFDTNVADVELGETPQVCAHFVVDTSGTIHQLVPLKVLGNARMMRASTRLVRYLQGRNGILPKDVIGHAESLSSPYRRERVARLRTQTHGDFTAPEMRTYRARFMR